MNPADTKLPGTSYCTADSMQSLNAGNLVASMPTLSSLRELRSFPAAWKHAMMQCCTVILLFAFVAAVSQRAALGVVVLGMVRAFALLAIIAGGVPWATAVLSSDDLVFLGPDAVAVKKLLFARYCHHFVARILREF